MPKSTGSFTDLILDVPEEHFHLQTPGLTRDGAVQAIDQLLALQAEWTELEKELGDSLYVDTLPHEGDITFDARGLSTRPSNFSICDSRGSPFGRSVQVIATGFVQVGDTPGTAVWGLPALACP